MLTAEWARKVAKNAASAEKELEKALSHIEWACGTGRRECYVEVIRECAVEVAAELQSRGFEVHIGHLHTIISW